MMCLMRDENEREREAIVMKDDVSEMRQHMCCCCWERWLMPCCGVNERDGKIRECEDDDVLWNGMSVIIIMFVSLSGVNKRKQL